MTEGSLMKATMRILGATLPTGQRVDLVDPVDELGPAFSKSASGRGRLVLHISFAARASTAAHCPNAIGVDAVEMDEMLVGLRDVDKNSSQKLQGVETGFIVDLVTGFGLVEDEPGVLMIAKAGQVHRGAKQVAGEPVEPFGVVRIDGGVVVNAEAGIPPRQEQVDTLFGDELAVSEESQNFVPKDELGLMTIDVGDGLPRSITEENSASDDGMDVRVPSKRRTKGLDDGNHTGASVGLVDGGGHHLADGLVGESGQLSQKLAVVEEIGPEHFGQRENPLRVRDVAENTFVQQHGEDGRSFRST